MARHFRLFQAVAGTVDLKKKRPRCQEQTVRSLALTSVACPIKGTSDGSRNRHTANFRLRFGAESRRRRHESLRAALRAPQSPRLLALFANDTECVGS